MPNRFLHLATLLALSILPGACRGQEAGQLRPITGWEVSPTFPADRLPHGTATAVQAAPRIRWRELAAGPGGDARIAAAAVDAAPRSVLLRRAIASAEPASVRLRVSNPGPVTALVNGVVTPRSPADGAAEGERFVVELRKGRNEVLLLLTEGAAEWRVRVAADADLPPVPTGPEPVVAWTTEAEFLTPESVVHDAGRGCLYVSNFDNQNAGRTGATGFLSRLGLDGEVLARRWVTGLRGPTGMALVGERLFVAVHGHLAEVDVIRGEVVRRHAVSGAAFLNDVAAGPDGSVYVSNSTARRGADVTTVFRLANGRVEPWLDGTALHRVNGLCCAGDALLVGNSGDGSLRSVDLATKSIRVVTHLGVGIVDGVQATAGGALVSHWEGPIYRVAADGTVSWLADLARRGGNAADFAWVENRRLLVVPTFAGNRVTALRLP